MATKDVVKFDWSTDKIGGYTVSQFERIFDMVVVGAFITTFSVMAITLAVLML
jgi:hypothetical protein